MRGVPPRARLGAAVIAVDALGHTRWTSSGDQLTADDTISTATDDELRLWSNLAVKNVNELARVIAQRDEAQIDAGLLRADRDRIVARVHQIEDERGRRRARAALHQL